MNPIATEWCRDIRERFEERFGVKARRSPDLVNLEPHIQERMMRIGIEARALQIDTQDRDQLAIVAHHTVLLDELRLRHNFAQYS